MFPEDQHTKAVVQRWPTLYPVVAAEIGHVKNHPCGAGFEDMKCYGKQLSLGWVRGQEAPGEGATSVAVRIKGLMQRIKNRVSVP